MTRSQAIRKLRTLTMRHGWNDRRVIELIAMIQAMEKDSR